MTSNYFSNYILPIVNTSSIIPASTDLFVKNAYKLKDVELCDFLQEMDDEEKRIQTLSSDELVTQEEYDEYKTRLLVAERLIYQIGCGILNTAGGALIGGMDLGIPGAVGGGIFCGLFGNKAFTNYWTAKEKAMEIYKPRLDRIKDKIGEITKEKLHLDLGPDYDQLNIAKTYLVERFKYYSEAAAKIPLTLGTNTENSYSIHFDKKGNSYYNGKIKTYNYHERGNYIIHEWKTTTFSDGYPKY